MEIKNKIFWLLLGLLIAVAPLFGAAIDYSSDSYKIKDPVITGGTPSSTSTNFGLGQSLGQTAIGKSTSTNFQVWSGFQYYFLVKNLYLGGAVENGQIRLFWSTPQTKLGVSIGSYEVGTGTVSGSYTFQDVGNVTTYTKTGLTNGTTYYFKVKAKTAAGTFLLFSNEFSTVPQAVHSAEAFDALPPGQTLTKTFSSSNGINVNFTIPPGALETGDTYRMEVNSLPKTELISSMPPPSGKSVAATMFEFAMFKESDFSTFSSFSEPLTVQVSYTDADVSGLDTSTLSLSRWTGSEWSALSNQTLNTTAKTINGTTSSFSNFAILGTASSGSSGSGGGGGGGGGGGSAPPPAPTLSGATIVIKGLTSPEATVTVLKDGAISATTTADPGANFSVTVTGLNAGIYSFSVYAADTKGVKSPTLSFFQSLTTGIITTVDNLFLGPTIGLSHTIVKQGDTLTIFGYTAPSADVSVFVNSHQQYVDKIKSSAAGAWSKAFNTIVLELGGHNSRSQASKDNLLSSYSNTVEFQVGDKSVEAPPPGQCGRADLNCDGRVNLTDFSILLFNWGTNNPVADLNKDGAVNLQDFSILLFYWTG